MPPKEHTIVSNNDCTRDKLLRYTVEKLLHGRAEGFLTDILRLRWNLEDWIAWNGYTCLKKGETKFS